MLTKIQALKEYVSSMSAEFRPENMAIFTDDSGNRIYMKSNYERITYNPATKERVVSKLSEEEFYKIMAGVYSELDH